MAQRKKVAVYARLSRDSDASTSISRQLEACEAYAVARGFDVVATAEDVDVSGSKIAPADRPGFAQLLERTDVELVLVYRIDRAARSVTDFAELLKVLEARGVGLVSVTEPFDMSTPAGRALTFLVAIFAEMESAATSARVKSSNARLRTAGRWSHGQAPYGYRTVAAPNGAPGKVLELDPVEAETLRYAASQVLAGARLYAVVRDLNERGAKPRRAEVWTSVTLRQSLTGDHLLGRVRHRGQLVRGVDGEPLEPWPAVLTVAELEGVRAALKPVARGVRAPSGRLLAGLVRCSSCGRRAQVSRSGAKAAYRCGNARPCSARMSVDAERLEAYVTEQFLELYGDRPIMRRGAAPAKPAGVDDLNDQIAALLELVTEAEETPEAELDLLRRLKVRRAELLKPVAERPLEPLGITVRDVFEDSPTHSRRGTLEELGLSVSVSKGTPGRHGLDASRVSLVFAAEAPLTA